MSGKRRSFDPEFKLKCVLDVLSGRKTPAQVCREHGLNESILARWRCTINQHVRHFCESRCEKMSVAMLNAVGYS